MIHARAGCSGSKTKGTILLSNSDTLAPELLRLKLISILGSLSDMPQTGLLAFLLIIHGPQRHTMRPPTCLELRLTKRKIIREPRRPLKCTNTCGMHFEESRAGLWRVRGRRLVPKVGDGYWCYGQRHHWLVSAHTGRNGLRPTTEHIGRL